MTPCSDRILELNALLDGELDAVNAAAIEAHVKNCADCSAEFDRLRSLRVVLSEAALRYDAPAGFRARIEAALPAAAPATRPSRAAWAALGAGLATAATVALMLGTAWIAPQIAPRIADDDFSRQLVGSHVRSLLASHLVDVATSDQHVVRPWFNGRIDFSPPTPDLAASGFPLVGGRLDYIADQVIPAIVYRRRRHTINLFVLPERPRAATMTLHFQGYNLREWKRDGLEFWAVSDVPANDLALFQQSVIAAR